MKDSTNAAGQTTPMAIPKTVDGAKFIEDLEAGIFSQKVGTSLRQAVERAFNFDKGAEVTVSFKISRLGTGRQVLIKHGLKSKMPTANGSIEEINVTDSTMFFNVSGSLTLFPEEDTKQLDAFKG